MSLPETVDAFVPSNFQDLLTQGHFRPAHIELSELQKLDSSLDIFKSTLELSKKLYSQTLLNHCFRCFYFALAILRNGFPSNTPSVRQIPGDVVVKKLYLTCLLHDFGLSNHTEAQSHPAHDMTFEFHGGIMAYEHLRDEYASSLSLNDSQIADITQGIMLHTAPFEHGKSSAVGILIQLSAFLDAFGYGAFGRDSMECLIHRDTVQEIEQAFPRVDMGQIKEGFENMFEVKPDCLVSHFPAYFQNKDHPLLGDRSVVDSH
ncbi:hypothetical protein D9757_011855 [Collybiopsis confluens]|uniref:HD/PDEase domain-containing protein n=1 Tax=Collybiopsis confluens TaxID=2823264 RepID=A0A8H5D5E7_9AGAR|nr:hypothetical protein D9757_011855 [Collybiopsis confluens]